MDTNTSLSSDRLDTPSTTNDLPKVWDMFGEDRLLQRLLILARMIDRVTSRRLQTLFGLSVAQWRVLAYLAVSGPATATAIGEGAEADQAEVSRAVLALVEKGLVVRDFEPGNRKKLVITLTSPGRDLHAEVRQSRRAYFKRAMEGVSRSQRTDFEDIMAMIARNVVLDRTAG